MKIYPSKAIFMSAAGKKDITTLMYHAIGNDVHLSRWPWAISYSEFCEQLDILRKYGWHTICPNELEKYSTLPPRTAIITFDDGYANNIRALEALVDRGMKGACFIVTRDIGGKSSWPGESIPSQPMLNAAQLRNMESAGMEICSHTVSHCRLTEANDTTIKNELADSKKRLSDILGRDVSTFAYPYGLYDSRVVDATRNAGYRIAFTTVPGFGTIDNDYLRLRRITVLNADSISTFSRKLALGWYNVSWDFIAKEIKRRALRKIRKSIGSQTLDYR
jgi:peptidoglycan/xylan/chitin deacetylase (PgdA/CDA1 family)